MEQEKKDTEIYAKVCPKCGKIIESMYKKQLDYNMKAHLITCNGESK